MSILDEREEYLKNPYFKEHEYGDFTPFYVTIAFCTALGGVLFILNIVFCWCSRHREYWQNRHTGNRWIQPLWTVLPHKTPPLDLSELESGIKYPQVRHEVVQYQEPESQGATPQPQEYMEMQKRENTVATCSASCCDNCIIARDTSYKGDNLKQHKIFLIMGLHVFWPATACLTLFVVCVIIVLLKYGARFCKLRHEPLPSDQEWEGKAYARKLSVSMA